MLERRLRWEKAYKHFKILKVHQDACLENVEKITPAIANAGKKWIKNPKNSLFLSGNTGSGKTYFCIALLRELIESYNPWVIYIRSDALDNELLKAVEDRQEDYVLEKYNSVPYLFIDDLGVERISDRLIKQYYSLIDTRMGNLLPTIFTSNTAMENIKNTLGDRIASRLEMAIEIRFPKKDLRKELVV